MICNSIIYFQSRFLKRFVNALKNANRIRRDGCGRRGYISAFDEVGVVHQKETGRSLEHVKKEHCEYVKNTVVHIEHGESTYVLNGSSLHFFGSAKSIMQLMDSDK